MRRPHWMTIALIVLLVSVATITLLNQRSCTDLRREASETTDTNRLWVIAEAAEREARNDRYDFGDYNEAYVCDDVAREAAEKAITVRTR